MLSKTIMQAIVSIVKSIVDHVIIYLLTFDILMLSRVSHYWTDADLLFHSQPRHSVLDTRDGMGVGMVSLGGTADPLPLPISCTNNMPHVSWARPILYSDRSSPAPKLLRSTGHSILPVVSNSLYHWLAEA